MKNKAFTLAEILISLTIIGIISILMIKNADTTQIKGKMNTAKAYKVFNAFDNASIQIRELNKVNCPMGTFIVSSGKNSSGNYVLEKALIDSGKDAVDSQEALDIYGEQIKFSQTGINFCEYSGYCDESTTDIAGVKMPGDIYVGMEVTNIGDCPSYYFPEINSQLTVRNNIDNTKPQCWAKLYVDVNGKEDPNTLGEDVFIYGIDAYGIYH